MTQAANDHLSHGAIRARQPPPAGPSLAPPSTTTRPVVTEPRSAEAIVLDIAPPSWCWSRLTSTHEGTLTFELTHGRVNLPVPYAVDDQQIIIALAPINTTGWQAAGRPATLVITGTDHSLHWLVRATGHATRARADEHDARLLASPHDRPRLLLDPPPHQLVLTYVTVHGYYETLPADATFVHAP